MVLRQFIFLCILFINYAIATPPNFVDDFKYKLFHVLKLSEFERDTKHQKFFNAIYYKKPQEEAEALLPYFERLSRKQSLIAGTNPTQNKSYVTVVFRPQKPPLPEHAAIIVEFLDQNQDIQYRFCDVALRPKRTKEEKDTYQIRVAGFYFILRQLIWNPDADFEHHQYVPYYKFITFPVDAVTCSNGLREIEQESAQTQGNAHFNTLINNCCHYAERNLTRLGVPLFPPYPMFSNDPSFLRGNAAFGLLMMSGVYAKEPVQLKVQCIRTWACEFSSQSLFFFPKSVITRQDKATAVLLSSASLQVDEPNYQKLTQEFWSAAKREEGCCRFMADPEMFIDAIQTDILSDPLRWYQFGVLRGNTKCQSYLGNYLLGGLDGNVRNRQEGINLLRHAANNGLTEAQYYFGKIFAVEKMNIMPDPEEVEESLKWLTHAAEAKHRDAQFCLGKVTIEQAAGVRESIIEGLQWLHTAAANGHSSSFTYLQNMANDGNAAAHFLLAELYYTGSGVNKDEQAALRCYKLASKNGSEPALMFLRKIASQGNAEAQFIVGKNYLKGRGVLKNNQESLRWLGLAARQGHLKAHELITKVGSGGMMPVASTSSQLPATNTPLQIPAASTPLQRLLSWALN